MIRKAMSLFVALAAIATLSSAKPAQAAIVGGTLAVGYTKLSNGATAYVNVGITDYGKYLGGSIVMVSGSTYVQAGASSIIYDPANRSHATVNFIGLMNGKTLVNGSIEVYLDNATTKTGRFGMVMINPVSRFAVSSASIAALQGNVWVVAP
jgi:hypothetical protein